MLVQVILAVIPIAWLIISMAVLKMAGYKSCGIGCFVTGSATSACVMFASLQQNIAQQLGISEAWLIAANSAGATAGKMISPQSIALGVAAIGVPGSDGRIMSRTIGWCALYIVIVCVVCYLGVIL